MWLIVLSCLSHRDLDDRTASGGGSEGGREKARLPFLILHHVVFHRIVILHQSYSKIGLQNDVGVFLVGVVQREHMLGGRILGYFRVS